MDEKIKARDALLVKEKDDAKLKVVSGMNTDGKLKTVCVLFLIFILFFV